MDEQWAQDPLLTCFFCNKIVLCVPSSEARSTLGMSPSVVKNMYLKANYAL